VRFSGFRATALSGERFFDLVHALVILPEISESLRLTDIVILIVKVPSGLTMKLGCHCEFLLCAVNVP